MKILIACTLALFASPALAGDAKTADKKAPAAPPAPPPEVKKTVDAFVGTWTFEGNVMLPGAKAPLKATESITCRSAAGGRAAACSGKANIPGLGAMEDDALVTYDAEAKNVRFVGMDSMGEVHDHICAWKDDKTLACQTLNIMVQGQPASVEFTMTFPSAKDCTFNETTTMKDGSKMSFDGKGKRK